MAGRGRGSVLPAWMTAEQGTSAVAPVTAPASAPAPVPAFAPAPPPAVPQFRAPPPPMVHAPPPPQSVPQMNNNFRPPPQFADSHARAPPQHPPPQVSYSAPVVPARPAVVVAHPVTEPKLTWESRNGTKKSNFDVGPNGEVALPVTVFGQPVPPPQHTQSAPVHVGGGNTAVDMSASKHARRLYVGGIPRGVPENEISAFFTDVVHKTAAQEYISGGPVVLNVWLNTEKAFAFVEFSGIELASACIALDGINFTHSRGSAVVRVRRPNDYRPDLVPPNQTGFIPLNLGGVGGVVSTTVPDGPNKIFFGGVPNQLTVEQIKELFVAFGPLKSFHLVKDAGQAVSKGFGFLEFNDANLTPVVCMAMNGFQIGDRTLTVKTQGGAGAPPGGPGAQAASYPGAAPVGHALGARMPTKVLRLLNMITKEELFDDNEYADIIDDVSGECSQYGRVTKIIIPRSKDGFPPSCDGSVFIQYADLNGSQAAAGALSGRKFAERVLAVEFYDEASFMNSKLDQ